MYFERLLLTNRPPPMSPPMSHTVKEIWSVSSFVQLGKKSSRLAMMLMKAVGNRMRPVRRAHFPVQHISSFFILRSVFASGFLFSPLRSSLCTTTLSQVSFLLIGEMKLWSEQEKEEEEHWPGPTHLNKYNLQKIKLGRNKDQQSACAVSFLSVGFWWLKKRKMFKSLSLKVGTKRKQYF